MKRVLYLLALSWMGSLGAQQSNELSEDLFKHLGRNAYILSEGKLISGEQSIQSFVNDFSAVNGKDLRYKRLFSQTVNKQLDYKIGEIQTLTGTFSAMSVVNKSTSSQPEVAFLVLYKKGNPVDQSAEIDLMRTQWMELCNAHKADQLVSQVYTAGAYYYNRGRLIQGTEAISQEYGYMNDPAYSLKLTPKHVVFVAEHIAYEIGQCSGSYPLPYMLLWEKQKNGTWQVLMDSNY
jgi:hypothetical protein